jgi:hypothetical protein
VGRATQRAHAEYLSKPPRPVLDMLGDPQHRTTLILGDPGSGKSSLLRYIALCLADPPADVPAGLVRWAGWLPILVELREYAGKAWRTDRWARGTLLAYLDYLHAHHGGPGLPHDVVDTLLSRESSVVVMRRRPTLGRGR